MRFGLRNIMRVNLTLALPTALALIFLASWPAIAQEPTLPQEPPPPMPTPKPKPTPTPAEPKDEDYDVVRVNSNLVVVPVSVTDASGQPVMGLKVEDFRLEEEGRPQQITQMGDPEQVPLEIALLLDVSGSVNSRFEFEKEAAARFLKQVLKSEDRAAIFAIDQSPRMAEARATVERASARLLTMAPARGPTAFYDSVIEAARYLSANTPGQHRRVIVVISDGEDNYSKRTKQTSLDAYNALNQDGDAQTNKRNREQVVRQRDESQRQALLEVQRELQRAEVTFYSINPSGEALRLNLPGVRAQEGMAGLATATGGNSFVPDRLENLDGVFRQITSELRSQYLLQYYSNNQGPASKFLRIKVDVPAKPSARVRARQGYYPKGSK